MKYFTSDLGMIWGRWLTEASKDWKQTTHTDAEQFAAWQIRERRVKPYIVSALTHKSKSGTYQAFAVDIGCYAHMRKLHGRFTELDLANSSAKERMRSASVLDVVLFEDLWNKAPVNTEAALREEDVEAA